MTEDEKLIQTLLEQIEWFVNLGHGVSMDGGRPSQGEWLNALSTAENLLDDQRLKKDAAAKEAF